MVKQSVTWSFLDEGVERIRFCGVIWPNDFVELANELIYCLAEGKSHLRDTFSQPLQKEES